MSSRPKPVVKTPAKGGVAAKGTKTSKPAAKTAAPAKTTQAGAKTNQVPAKKGGKSEAAAGPSKEVKDEPALAASKQEEKKEPVTTATRLTVKEIKNLSEDEDGKIRQAGKPLLVVDNDRDVACTYMKYASTSTLLDGTNPRNLTPEQIRQGVLSCVRFGKSYVVDMKQMAEGMFDELKKQFDLVKLGLFDSCMDRSIRLEANYTELIKKEDGDGYSKFYFTEEECDKFYLVILSTNKNHSEAFKAKFNLFYIED